MGSISRQSRCDRFINEFEEDLLKKHSIQNPCILGQSLGVFDATEQVFLFVSLQNGEIEEELIQPYPFFDPEEPSQDSIARIVEQLGITPAMAKKRFKRAGL